MLELAMARVRAQEQLEDPDYAGRLTMEGLHDLLLRAGYSKEVAREVSLQRGWDRLGAGQTA